MITAELLIDQVMSEAIKINDFNNSSNNSNYTFPTAITVNNETITNPFDITNHFNNYFAKVAIDIQSSIRFFKKKYFDYLPSLNIE